VRSTPSRSCAPCSAKHRVPGSVTNLIYSPGAISCAKQEITAPESDPARMEGSLHEDTHRAWLDEQLGESLLPRGALPLSEQDPAWPQQVQEMASLRHSGGSPPVRPRSPAAAAQSHPTDRDDRLGPAAQEEAASAASPGRVPETTGEDRREPLPEGAAQGQRAETDAEDSAAAGAAAGDGAKSGAGLGRLAQAVATLRRVTVRPRRAPRRRSRLRVCARAEGARG
jgi:hypothetical protein